MSDSPRTGVLIADARSSIRLSRAGQANETGYPTLIETRAGTFTGAVRDDTVQDYAAFLQQLETLYQRLTGTASLGSHDGFTLTLAGNGHGGIAGSAVIVAEHVPSIQLIFEFTLDQSYLPPIIRAIQQEFPPLKAR